MLVCYLDDSGTDSTAPILTMAGYLGTFTGWAFFEQDARNVFADFGVTTLHGKEFNATKGDFAQWPRRKKEALAARLYWDLKKVVHFGVTASIKKAAFAKAKSHGGHPNESPYGYCFRQILDQIMYSAVMKVAATHLRRWSRHGLAKRSVVEWNGKAVEGVRKGFEAAVRAAGLGAEVTPHVLRHTCATWLMQKGVNLWDAAGFLGMTVQQLEQGYGHHHPDYQEDAVAALGGQYGARNSVNKARRTDANVTKIDAISKGG